MEENQRQNSVVHLLMLLNDDGVQMLVKMRKENLSWKISPHLNFYHSLSHSKCFQEGIPLLGGFQAFGYVKV